MFNFLKNGYQPSGIDNNKSICPPHGGSSMQDEISTKRETEFIESEDDFEIITGENRFETKFLSYCNYLLKYRDQIISNIPADSIELKNKKTVRKFLDWDDIKIDKNSFKFVQEFVTAYKNISELYPIKYSAPRIYIDSDGSDSTKSVKISIFLSNNTNFITSFNKQDIVYFDFYKIPSRINSALDAMDSEVSSMLEQYINEGTIDKDINYVEISRKVVSRYDDISEKSVTIKNYRIDDVEDTYDRYWLESIHNMVYVACKSIYIDMINSINNSIMCIERKSFNI